MTQRKQLNRRDFLVGSSALGFALFSSGKMSIFREAEAQAVPDQVADKDVGAWVRIYTNDQVTIRFAAAEMGQGVNTALPMIFAEEMDADWSQVTVEQIAQDPERVYGNPKFGGALFTAGSVSIEGYFMVLRQAGAKVRRILMQTAAVHWGAMFEELQTEPGAVVNSRTGQRMTYGEIAALPILLETVPDVADVDLKPQKDWRIIGSDVQRLDIPAKTKGEPIYSIDMQLPNMLYAAQLMSPVEGEKPIEVSDNAARAVDGVFDVVTLSNSVTILAETWHAAQTARDLLEVTWSETSPFRQSDSEKELNQIAAAANDMSRQASVWTSRGEPISILKEAGAQVISSQYTTEYVYHAQMEPLNALASVDADGKGAEVWLGSQSQGATIGIAAGVLKTTPDRIKLHAMQMGGAFGRRTVFARDLLKDALLLSKKAKRPVKLIWTRENDVKQGWFRPATAHRFDAVLSDDGDVLAMRHRIVSPSIMSFAFPQKWDPVIGRDLLTMKGTEADHYAIDNLVSEHVITERQSRIAAWRGIGWGPSAYARECFIDELAEAAGSDPVLFRRRLLRENERGLKLLEAVVSMSNFGNPPDGRAHGLAFAPYGATQGVGVAEVSVDDEDGSFRVHRFWAAVDPGIVIHPKNYEAQVEGGIIFGLSSLMNERITILGGEVQENNFYDYEIMRLDQTPEVKIKLIESNAAPSGGGEIGVPMTGPAVANALRQLRGKAPTSIPFSTI